MAFSLRKSALRAASHSSRDTTFGGVRLLEVMMGSPAFGGSMSLQVGGFVQRPDLDLARPGHGVRAALHPGDRLVHVLDLPQPEAGNQLARVGKRPVTDYAARAIERHALAM